MKKIIVSILAILAFSISWAQNEKFQLPALPYSFDALEPYIDAQTMEIHHDKHHAGYVNNLNKAIVNTPLEKKSLEDILLNISSTNSAVRNNAGGHYNHSLFWTVLAPKGTVDFNANSKVGKAILKQFHSLDSLKKMISDAGAKQFGSGWAWLCVSPKGDLCVCNTPNQDNPLMNTNKDRGIPILGIDVWEHAYYLKYQNKRGDYLSQIWNVINWNEIDKRYNEALDNKSLLNKLK